MKGKIYFPYVYPFLLVFSWVLYIFPTRILSALWGWLDFFPGLLGAGLRYGFALRLAKKLGRNVYFGRGIEVLKWRNLEVGNNVSIHAGCYIDASGGLVIGNDVSIAHHSSIVTFNHTWADITKPIRSNRSSYNKIVIADDVWIGCGVRLLPGVKISSRVVIAAGAVVVKDVSSNSLVGGVPAKFIKKI